MPIFQAWWICKNRSLATISKTGCPSSQSLAASTVAAIIFTKIQVRMKKLLLLPLITFVFSQLGFAQQLVMPSNGTNPRMTAGVRIGVTDVTINWGAPGVKGREGKIWGTDVAHYGFTNLGFGTAKESPWRAGADECTTISFSTDVTIEGKTLPAGKYALFMILAADETTLIFSKNPAAWGSYFYDPKEDVLRVTVRQQKDLPQSRERLTYLLDNPTDRSVTVALEWERWRIPFKVEVDPVATGLASIRSQMTSGLGFDPPSLQAAAQWCLTNNVNLEEALFWIESATSPNLGGVQTFSALNIQAGFLRKLGRNAVADETLKNAMAKATVMELHSYGRQLISEKKPKEALAVFEQNHKQNNGAWPTNVGLARGYSANGDLKKALEHAKLALAQAPDATNKTSLEAMIKTLSEGKPIAQ
jgi:tetratricopeptide (TPR) repeat protein